MRGNKKNPLQWLEGTDAGQSKTETGKSLEVKATHTSETDLLDAYSQAVIAVIDAVGPAKQAGMIERDIVVAVGGIDVTSIDDIFHFLAEWPVGGAVVITVIRGKERRDIEVISTEAE